MKAKKKKRSKGFTLVELLAVIVILAVVMLIAVTAVGPIMERSRKNAIASEGLSLIKAAKNAYRAEQLNESSLVKEEKTVCFSMRWLCQNGYYEKGCDGKDNGDGYFGSALVKYDSTTKMYTYYYWIGNNKYVIGNPKMTTTGTNANTFSNRYIGCAGKGGIQDTKNVGQSDVKDRSSVSADDATRISHMNRCGVAANADGTRLYYSSSSTSTYRNPQVVYCHYYISGGVEKNDCLAPTTNGTNKCAINR